MVVDGDGGEEMAVLSEPVAEGRGDTLTQSHPSPFPYCSSRVHPVSGVLTRGGVRGRTGVGVPQEPIRHGKSSGTPSVRQRES